VTRLEGQPDKTRLEFVFDAQTSGGLLISVAADRADELVAKARAAGATLACVIGSVTAKQDVSVVIRG
jgi:selenide,water dikinase